MTSDDILTGVSTYFAVKLAQHGPTAKGVDWNGEQSQRLRHRQFDRLWSDDPASTILDLGCGYGDFLSFLRQSGFRGRYIGYDVAPEMIAAARRLHGESESIAWRVGSYPTDRADFAVASGIFNLKGETTNERWKAYVLETIDVLASCGRRGFGFNILSLCSDPEKRRPDLYYADPVEMLDYCLKRFGRSVALLQDYGQYDFTVIVRRD